MNLNQKKTKADDPLVTLPQGISANTSTTKVVVIPASKWEQIEEQLGKLEKLDILDGMFNKLENIDHRLSALENSFTFHSDELTDLKTESMNLKQTLVKNTTELHVTSKLLAEQNEQYSRRENVRISEITETEGENLDTILIDIAKKVGVTLKS